jgi:disulfide bond formation protein DsbB
MDALPLTRTKWPFLALAACASMLAAAHGFEIFLLLAPCDLCYQQRHVFWAAGGLALLTALLIWRGAPVKLITVLNVLLGVTFLYSVWVAGYHSLVEWKILDVPSTCTARAAKISTDIWAELGKPQAVPSCDEVRWRMFGLSMANYNALISLGLAALSFVSATRGRRIDTANETTGEPAAG